MHALISHWKKNELLSEQPALRSNTLGQFQPCDNNPSKIKDYQYDPSTCQRDFISFVDKKLQTMMNHSSREWSDISCQLKDLVNLSKTTINAELEVHIGRHKSNGRHFFEAGVCLNWFEKQLSKMESFKGWDYFSKDWEKIEELIFEKDIR